MNTRNFVSETDVDRILLSWRNESNILLNSNCALNNPALKTRYPRRTGAWATPISILVKPSCDLWQTPSIIRCICRFLTLKQLCIFRLVNSLLCALCDQEIVAYVTRYPQLSSLLHGGTSAKVSQKPQRQPLSVIPVPLCRATKMQQEPVAVFITALDWGLPATTETRLRKAYRDFWTFNGYDFGRSTSLLRTKTDDVNSKHNVFCGDSGAEILFQTLALLNLAPFEKTVLSTLDAVFAEFRRRCPTSRFWKAMARISGYTLHAASPTAIYLPAPVPEIPQVTRFKALCQLDQLPYSFYITYLNCSFVKQHPRQVVASIIRSLYFWLRALLLTASCSS